MSKDGFNYEGHDPKLPGPGYYEPILVNRKDRYTMRPKTALTSKLELIESFSV